jgi:hypothetical protein
MNTMLQFTVPTHQPKVEFSVEEKAQLNVIIDLLIPSDQDFPPPSSLALVDDFLHYIRPRTRYKGALILSEKRLRATLKELNLSAGGNFCLANRDKQQSLLHHLEQHDPAFFQSFWTLVNHSYYASLATSHLKHA